MSGSRDQRLRRREGGRDRMERQRLKERERERESTHYTLYVMFVYSKVFLCTDRDLLCMHVILTVGKITFGSSITMYYKRTFCFPLSFCLSVCLSVCLSLSLSVCLSLSLSLFLPLSLPLSLSIGRDNRC